MTQWRAHGKFLDNKLVINPFRNPWTEDDKNQLEELLSQGKTLAEIAIIMDRSKNAVQAMSNNLGLGDKYLKKNSVKYKAIYQDYDWFFDCYINKGMSLQEIADAANATLRVIQKWADEKHHINSRTFRSLKHLTEIQKEIIIVGTLGDGHIDKRETQPMYIESHAEGEKDYLFWKYEYLKDLCNNEPVYYPPTKATFGTDHAYQCQAYYRLNTKIIDDLYEIRNMSPTEKIKSLSLFQICLLLLDDGSRGNLWELCVAAWEQKDVDLFLHICATNYQIRAKQSKDPRYIHFDAFSSKKIDEAILTYLPNNLDIVKKKITENARIKDFKNAKYIICNNNERWGLNKFCRAHGIIYKKAKAFIDTLTLPFNEITEEDFLEQFKEVESYAI